MKIRVICCCFAGLAAFSAAVRAFQPRPLWSMPTARAAARRRTKSLLSTNNLASSSEEDSAGEGREMYSSGKGMQNENSLFVDGDTATTNVPSSTNNEIPQFRSTSYDLAQAAIIGILTGVSVALFKLSIEALREVCYRSSFLATFPSLMALIPAFGGIVVGALLLFGGDFPPGLRGTVKEVDDESKPHVRDFMAEVRLQLNNLRKSVAAIFTLGTGCSLGPEGPCVEIGMNVARACMDINPRRISRQRRMSWNRLLLSCGAAAGVAAGFNAPIAGVFFALEIMQNAFSSVREGNGDGTDDLVIMQNAFSSVREDNVERRLSTTATVTPILLASVLSALIARTLLGNHLILTLTEYSLKTPLIELPLYLILGVMSGFVAFCFSWFAKLSQSFFSGELGSNLIRARMHSMPAPLKPVLGGLLCGIVGLAFPQILFFGYETLNSLLANNSLPTDLLLSLLLVKTIMTAISAGSGLVGGTFAPSLFLGAMMGASFHNIVAFLFQTATDIGGLVMVQGPTLDLADVPAYAMVGAASVLAALFRAPLTASLLLFELTRDYDVILPLMASAGVGSIVGDILDDKFERAQQRRRRDQDSVSWGDLADRENS